MTRALVEAGASPGVRGYWRKPGGEGVLVKAWGEGGHYLGAFNEWRGVFSEWSGDNLKKQAESLLGRQPFWFLPRPLDLENTLLPSPSLLPSLGFLHLITALPSTLPSHWNACLPSYNPLLPAPPPPPYAPTPSSPAPSPTPPGERPLGLLSSRRGTARASRAGRLLLYGPGDGELTSFIGRGSGSRPAAG